jgi:hypothetical protein
MASAPTQPGGQSGGSSSQQPSSIQLQMKYAWDWFQYHADQRLKAFNYFVVVSGILIAAYGAAMQKAIPTTPETRPYSLLASLVAFFGAVI